jgi:hypothetical protein
MIAKYYVIITEFHLSRPCQQLSALIEYTLQPVFREQVSIAS